MDLPKKIIQVLRSFEGVFSQRVWQWAKVLLIGAILAPGERTVTAILRVMGLWDEQQFQKYHRVLNRAKWSSRAVSRILLLLLVDLFVPATAPVVVGIDETIERRRGSKIAARGIYRDPVRSSKEFFVKTSGLRWISMMLLTPIRLCQTCVGFALFDRACPLSAVSRAARQEASNHHGLGPADDRASASLVAGSGPGDCRRWKLRGAGVSGERASLASGHHRHAHAFGCSAL